MELEDDKLNKLEQLKTFVNSKEFYQKVHLECSYPENWTSFMGDSQLFSEEQIDQFLTEQKDWRENRDKYSFEENVKDTIRYFERIFENALKELISLSTEFKNIFFIALNKFEDIQRAGNDIEKVKCLFFALCQFLEQNLINKMKSFSVIDHTFYSRKNVIIESIATKSQFSEDVIEFLIMENRIVLIEKLMARIRGDVCIIFYLISNSKCEQKTNIINSFFFLLDYIKYLIGVEYRCFLRDVELSFKQKNIPEGVHAQLQRLKEQYVNNEPTLSWKEIGIALGGRGQEYVRLLKKAMKKDGIEMISGNVTLSQAKEFVSRTGFHRTRNGYKCDKTGYEFKYSKRGKEKGKVTKRK